MFISPSHHFTVIRLLRASTPRGIAGIAKGTQSYIRLSTIRLRASDSSLLCEITVRFVSSCFPLSGSVARHAAGRPEGLYGGGKVSSSSPARVRRHLILDIVRVKSENCITGQSMVHRAGILDLFLVSAFVLPLCLLESTLHSHIDRVRSDLVHTR